MLEEMGFERDGDFDYSEYGVKRYYYDDSFCIDKHRLKAGVAGASYALQELQFDLNHFPDDETTPAKQRLIDEINNLKTFLGEL